MLTSLKEDFCQNIQNLVSQRLLAKELGLQQRLAKSYTFNQRLGCWLSAKGFQLPKSRLGFQQQEARLGFHQPNARLGFQQPNSRLGFQQLETRQD